MSLPNPQKDGLSWTPLLPLYRSQVSTAKAAFNGNQELRPPPERLFGDEILRMAEKREEYLRRGGTEDSENDPVKSHGVKSVSILFSLPYLSVSNNLLPSTHDFVCFSMNAVDNP